LQQIRSLDICSLFSLNKKVRLHELICSVGKLYQLQSFYIKCSAFCHQQNTLHKETKTVV